MRRWNGWGDEAIDLQLADEAREFLSARIGEGSAPNDAPLDILLARIPLSRLPDHRLVSRDPEARLQASVGQSLEDWLRLRFGRVQAVVDGVAFPETEAEVRETLDWAMVVGAVAIAVGGATSVVGHLTLADGKRRSLAIAMTRLRRLLKLDPISQLATFEAGVAGPDLEAQLRAHGFVLGHYPQSFEYSTLGGWIATRSCGQQSARYGRIEALFAGGKDRDADWRARPAGLSCVGRRPGSAGMGVGIRGPDRNHHKGDSPRVAGAGARNVHRLFPSGVGRGPGCDAGACSGEARIVDGEARQRGRDGGDAAACGRRPSGRLRTGAPPDDVRALMTAVLADATNLGLTRMARSAGAFSHSRLLWVAEWHVRDETYQSALACLVDAIHAQPFTRIWGDGDTSSSDGQFFRAGGHGEARAKFFEGRLGLAGKSLAKNFPMLGLGRAILPGSSALQFVSPSSRSRTCGEGRQGSA